MRIKYDNNKDYFKHYNISQGIIQSKNEILKKPKNKVFSYIGRGIFSLVFLLVMFIFRQIFSFIDFHPFFIKLIDIILMIILILIILYFVIFILGYLSEKNRNHVGDLLFDKDGITDINDEGIIVGVTWDKIEAIVLRKDTITIITKTPFFFFVDISLKNKILKALDEYEKDIKIIDKINK